MQTPSIDRPSRVQRALVVLFTLALMVGFGANVPASAATSTSIQLNEVNCTFTATYTWSGMHGKDLSGYIDLVDAGINTVVRNLTFAVTSDTGSQQATFALGSGSSHTFRANGYMFSPKHFVRGSAARTMDSVTANCSP
jgi:hypothetical protein